LIPVRFIVLGPHFEPDTAPTGVVMSRIVQELAARGHELHVVTSLPWYRNHRIEPGWEGRLVRVEQTTWGSVTRVHPFAGGDKRHLLRRGLGFVAFSGLVGLTGLRVGGFVRRVDVVIAMSPPLTLGLTGWILSLIRRGRLVFNVQDVFPDAVIETGAVTNRGVIAAARWLERITYRSADAVTVLSDDLRDNVAAKVPPRRRDRVVVIPNFVDVGSIRPADRSTPYRDEVGIGDEPVVMYAGNVGFSQSIELVMAAARALPHVTFVINGEGAARRQLERDADGLTNVRFVDYQPAERLGEVLASADVHVIPLRRGLGRVSVPSKTYSILAAGRPVVAAIDPDTEVPRLLERSGAGVTVPPDDPEAFTAAIAELVNDPQRAREMGRRGRALVESQLSPAEVAAAYEALAVELRGELRGDPSARRSSR
jgi:colanic acid biosynthesis glycosyl transferase WcaI